MDASSRPVLPALLLALVAVASDHAAAQSTLRVPSQYATITAALAAANDGDEVLVDDGTYNETNLDFAGRRLVLRSVGGAAVTILDAAGAVGPVVRADALDAAPRSVISGFTIRNAQGPTFGMGAIYADGRVEVVDCVVENCFGVGAGISSRASELVVRRCRFVDTGPSAIALEGAVSSAPPLGAITSAQVTVEASSFRGVRDSAVVVGAMAQVMVRSCEFVANRLSPASSGSLLSVEPAFGQLLFLSVLQVRGCTITADGGLDPVFGVTPGSFLVVRDSIVWGNANPTPVALLGPPILPTLIDFSYCDLEGSLPSGGGPVTVFAVQNLAVDPGFVDATNGDFSLAPGSPLIDVAENLDPIGTDVDGDPRALDGDADGNRRADIGADEVSRFGIAASSSSPAPGAGFSVVGSTPRPGDALLLSVLFVSVSENDVFFPAFGQLLLDPTSLVDIPMSAGVAALTNPGTAPGLQVSMQAIGVVSDTTGAFFQLSNRVHMTLR